MNDDRLRTEYFDKRRYKLCVICGIVGEGIKLTSPGGYVHESCFVNLKPESEEKKMETKPTIFKVKFTHKSDEKDEDGKMPNAREEFMVAPGITRLVIELNEMGYIIQGILFLAEDVTVIR